MSCWVFSPPAPGGGVELSETSIKPQKKKKQSVNKPSAGFLSLFLRQKLQHAHMVPRQPMGEGEAEVSVAPGRDYWDGQSSASDAPLSRLQLCNGQVKQAFAAAHTEPEQQNQAEPGQHYAALTRDKTRAKIRFWSGDSSRCRYRFEDGVCVSDLLLARSDNSEYDCWPLDKPNEYNMMDCGGLEMAWLLRPPDTVKSGEPFSVSYSVSAGEAFYRWAVENHIFTHRLTESICGPWIPDDGKIFTHTISTSGKMTQSNWTSKVVLVHSGLTSLIAHIRVGRMQVALEAKSTVEPAVVCGDGVCEEAELCSTCSADCGECPMTPTTKLSIGLPLSCSASASF
ncbi:hypothetical protein F7725_016210 [Dissostichus mawsoni]|uniref:Uncharacterized protein n=1 Tax=Dissostichus mawsoni TaxID=36200 RepID=A0A7J5Z3X2_DISMA|nr:hypothetical protein F7725_016210 [Dissostichus mawsoni]